MDAFMTEASIYHRMEPTMSEVENYANHPKSLASIKAERENDGALQTPRDVLINILRSIDGGKIDPYCLVVCYGEKSDGGVYTGFETGGGDSHTTLGIVTRAQHKMLIGQDEN